MAPRWKHRRRPRKVRTKINLRDGREGKTAFVSQPSIGNPAIDIHTTSGTVMQLTEQEQKMIDRAHRELDEQIRRAKRQRWWGKVGVVVVVRQGTPKRLGVVCDVTLDWQALE